MLLSVCIVNWNTRDYLRDCLASLEQYPVAGLSQEVIVVDNASVDASVEMVAADFPGVRVIANTDNRGYAEGNNEAIEAARGDYILLLNPDVVLHPDALTRAVEGMRADPRAGVLAGRLLSPDGSTQRSLRSFPDPGPVLWEYLGVARLFPRSRTLAAYRMSYFDYDHAGEVDQPMGTFLMISRRCLQDVGLMDTAFPIFFNEVDWCYRAKRHCGWRIVYSPEVVVTHFGGASTRQVKPRMVRESHRSLIRFYEKHYRKSIPPILYRLITQAISWNERRVLARLGAADENRA